MYDGVTDELGPIDYLVVELAGCTADLTGPLGIELASLVDAELIRVVDLVIVDKGTDGRYEVREIEDLKAADALGHLRVLEGQLAEVLGRKDLDRVVEALGDGATAAVLIWENTWAAPLVAAARRSGAEVVASDRVAMSTFVDALDLGGPAVSGRSVVREPAQADAAAVLARGIERRNHRAIRRRG